MAVVVIRDPKTGDIETVHDPDRPARLVKLELLTTKQVEEACCCEVGYNQCCAICHKEGDNITNG